MSRKLQPFINKFILSALLIAAARVIPDWRDLRAWADAVGIVGGAVGLNETVIKSGPTKGPR